MNDARLVSLTDKLNKYVALIRTENPNMKEKDIVDRAAHMALTDQKAFEAKAGIIPTDAVADRFGDGTRIETAEDGSSIVRVDNAWQQSKGSKISSDGFHKKDHSRKYKELIFDLKKLLLMQPQFQFHNVLEEQIHYL